MKKETILVIDDDREQQTAIQFILEKENYLVLTASDGQSGLKTLNDFEDIRVVIVDLVMLRESGIGVLEEIKGFKRPLRRIVNTGYNEQLTFQKAEELKVFCYLNKCNGGRQDLLFAVKSAFRDLYMEELKNELEKAIHLKELAHKAADFAHFLAGNKIEDIPKYIETIVDELRELPANVQSTLEKIKQIAREIIQSKKDKETEKGTGGEFFNSDYDVALSFAGEDREIVEKLAKSLQEEKIKVFYDDYEKAHLWGKNLYEHLQSVYRDKACFCIIFLSEAYARKLWTKHELEQAQARAFRERREYILPVRLDDTKIPQINETVGYIDLRHTPVEELKELILSKLSHHLKQ
jgi:CheY-like chemotaxis protein